jgi:hypothetical protein
MVPTGDGQPEPGRRCALNARSASFRLVFMKSRVSRVTERAAAPADYERLRSWFATAEAISSRERS